MNETSLSFIPCAWAVTMNGTTGGNTLTLIETNISDHECGAAVSKAIMTLRTAGFKGSVEFTYYRYNRKFKQVLVTFTKKKPEGEISEI